jgi:hypothetical protein
MRSHPWLIATITVVVGAQSRYQADGKAYWIDKVDVL